MSIARFVKVTESGKHACIMARKNAFDAVEHVGYVRMNTALEGKVKGDEFDIPDGWSIVNKQTVEGETLSTKDGEPLSFFTW